MNELPGISRFRMRIGWSLVISALLLVTHGPIIALAAPASTKEHTILVSVLNKAGHPVRQPRKDDLQLTENKQTVEISRMQSASPVPILFTLLIDTSKWARQEKTREAINGAFDFLKGIMRKNDRLLIASFSDQFHLGTQNGIRLGRAKKSIISVGVPELSSTMPLSSLPVRYLFKLNQSATS